MNVLNVLGTRTQTQIPALYRFQFINPSAGKKLFYNDTASPLFITAFGAGIRNFFYLNPKQSFLSNGGEYEYLVYTCNVSNGGVLPKFQYNEEELEISNAGLLIAEPTHF